MHDDEVTALARAALRLWGGGRVERLIANRENAVFEVTLRKGQRAALRLHRAGYQTDAAIRSELAWTDHLAQAGFPCPAPLRTEDGALLGAPAFGPRASVVGWVDAPHVGTRPMTPEAQCRLFHSLGGLIARMHRLSDAMVLPVGFERPGWTIDALTGPTPLWGPFWTNPALSASEADELREARDAARATLLARDWNRGLIHADLLQENILGTADALTVIDFDDGGFGLRLYDLGTAMVQHVAAPHHDDLAAALCEGYGADPRDLALFTLLRALASTGWLIVRLPADDPQHRRYADRALALARAFVG